MSCLTHYDRIIFLFEVQDSCGYKNTNRVVFIRMCICESFKEVTL